MELGFMLLVVAIVCAIATVRELKKQNLFASGFAGLSTLVFGFFAVGTLYWEIIRPLFTDA